MANFDDLKKTWQSQSEISQERFDQIGTKVKDGSDLLQTTIFRRDMLETFASVFVVLFFAPGLFTAKNWVAWFGFAILVIAGCTIPLVLWWARRRSLSKVSAANFRDFVNIEIDYLHRQVKLLRMVTWWYLLPIYIGIVLLVFGVTGWHRPTWFEAIFVPIYLTCCSGLFIYVWWLNQSARKKHFEPLLDYYVGMRTALDNGDDSALQLPGPPTAFLQPGPPRKPISKRRRWICIVLTVIVTALVAGFGFATMHYFDERTGGFVVSTAPVIAILMIAVTGIWRRESVRATS